MNAQLFLENFGHLANAPEGVKRLREMIYHLSVTGRLCTQIPTEGNGHDQLQEIVEQRNQRIDNGLFKRAPKLENLKGAFADQLPDIPESWAWSRLVDLGEIRPKNSVDDELPTSFASMSTISEKHGVSPEPEKRPWGSIKKGYTHFADGDVVVAKITPCFENGKAAVMRALTNKVGAGTTELHVVRPLHGLDPHFVYLFLRSPYFRVDGENHMTGTAGQKRLPAEYFATRPFPLPPFEEQKRIIAKTDELMALCDRLEAQQQERERRFPVLSRATHVRLAESPTFENLLPIFDGPNRIDPADLKKSILSLAVTGKMSMQISTDGDARDILNRKHHLPKGFKRRRKIMKRSSVAFPDALFPRLPSTWQYVTIQELYDRNIIIDYADGNHGSLYPRKAEFRKLGVTFVSAKDITNGSVSWDNCAKLGESKAEQLTKGWSEGGDVLLTHNATVGRVAIVEEGIKPFLLGTSVTFYRMLPTIIDRQYFYYVLCSPVWQRQLEEIMEQTTRNQVSIQKQAFFKVPLPPYSEQLRIVRVVDRLLDLVDQLEQQKIKKSKVAHAYAHAAVANITGTKTKDSQPMKAPKTELITELEIGENPKATDSAPLASLIAKSKDGLSAKALWQQSSLEIDAFYHQLKTEISKGWIVEPKLAVIQEVKAG